MAVLKFADFGGIVPGVDPAMLPVTAATVAHNCRIKSSRLEPLTEPEKDTRRINFEGGLSAIADAKTIFLWHKSSGESEWIAWKGRVSVAPSNLAVDKNSRLFVTGETGYEGNQPVMYIASEHGYSKYPIIKKALPKPVVKTATEPDTTKDTRYTYFFQTWVDRFGYESPVSEPSDEIEYNDGQTVSFGEVLITDDIIAAMKRRIYKVVTGTEGADIQFIAEQDRVGLKFLLTNIRVKDEDAGEILTQIEAPPETLGNLIWMPGSFYAGVDMLNRRTVCFSDINMPYSWPLAYRYTVKDDIVGIAAIGSSIVVLTTGSPWIISGTAPESMSVVSLSSPMPCVSADSICTLANVVYYASHSGICAISEGSVSVQLITSTWFTKESWEKLNPETCRMVAHDGGLFLWFDYADDDGVTRSHGYILDFSLNSDLRGDSAYSSGRASKLKAVTTHDEQAACVFEDVENGTLCYVRREP